jgi:hypothetical protein
MPGTQLCSSGAWLACICSPAPGSTSGASADDCKPGRYEGDFSGLYSSGYTFVGVPIPVFGLDAEGPGLAFTLNAQQGDGVSEFSTFTISDGYVRGTADGAFPFEGALSGMLDCRTKMFTGTLSGGYCVGPCADVNEAKFSGPITGRYDGTSFTFTGGTWHLVEEGEADPLGFDFGGDGDWNAHWVGEGSVDVDSGVSAP